jgi:hypothetical protein
MNENVLQVGGFSPPPLTLEKTVASRHLSCLIEKVAPVYSFCITIRGLELLRI